MDVSGFNSLPSTSTTPQQVKWDYDRSQILGNGGFGIVFRGHFNGMDAAVKRITKSHSPSDSREEKSMMKLDHPNIIKLFYVVSDDDFKYYIMELCEATIKDYCSGKYTGPMPSQRDALRQMTKGLFYIHSTGFVHRDIKPDNVLIYLKPSADERALEPQLKISDFGMSKPTSPSGSFSLTSGVRGTTCFWPAELHHLRDEQDTVGSVANKRANVSSDVFALGCVFYWYLTKGKHPFSDGRSHSLIPGNILQGKINMNDLPRSHFAYNVIAGMIRKEEKHRLKIGEVRDALLKTQSGKQSDAEKFFFTSWEIKTSDRVRDFSHNPSYPILAYCTGKSSVSVIKDLTMLDPIMFCSFEPKIPRLDMQRLEWNGNGELLAAIYGDDKCVVFWNKDGENLFESNNTHHEAFVNHLYWNPYNHNFLATCDAKNIFIWETSHEVQLYAKFKNMRIKNPSMIRDLAWISSNEFVFGTEDGYIRKCELPKERSPDEFSYPTSFICCKPLPNVMSVSWNDAIKSLAVRADSSTEDKSTVKVYYLGDQGNDWSGEKAIEPIAPPKRCLCVSWLQCQENSALIACGLADGSIIVTDVSTDEHASILRKHSNDVIDVSFSHDGKFLASIDKGGRVVISSTKNWSSIYETKVAPPDNWRKPCRLKWDPPSRTLFLSSKGMVSRNVSCIVVLEIWENQTECSDFYSMLKGN